MVRYEHVGIILRLRQGRTEAHPGGEIRGQVVPAGNAAADDDALFAALMEEGASVYRSCSGCHGSRGQGGDGAALAGNGVLANAGSVVSQIVNGGAYMPPFGRLSDRDVAAVATYVRNSFGNEFGIVTEAEVAAFR